MLLLRLCGMVYRSCPVFMVRSNLKNTFKFSQTSLQTWPDGCRPLHPACDRFVNLSNTRRNEYTRIEHGRKDAAEEGIDRKIGRMPGASEQQCSHSVHDRIATEQRITHMGLRGVCLVVIVEAKNVSASLHQLHVLQIREHRCSPKLKCMKIQSTGWM